ncbi:MAG: glutathione transferase GstA [Pseudomonadota bacterium]|jgi:glutathione S-transferase|uniref:Glutathione transferase GstA n=1 Tax=Metallibacterium scheffleri TaxID=993689 RepID=A0A4S3KG27_9GAMM|nr:glutathione transferase GstA [Metallibacterium scheffleri]MBU6403793.1 glutathione transferase GstA [Pseudomonadota bacterium]MDE3140938.1 glutathione transferase GstA [Pseudomonadota bacterium]THD07526.1 glutathione transferase GstA [Metallibacterium scheffleri]
MKLYFSPGACSLSPHIVLHELGLPFEAVQVDLKSKRLKDGADFWKINPKGYVPTLQLDDGAILTEGPAIVQYLADQKPTAGLAPANGTFARYRLQEWLNFISTELHKQFSPLFNPASTDAVKQAQQERLAERFREIVAAMGAAPYLLGDQFTVADAYLYTVLTWAGIVGVDLAPYPALQAFMKRVEARPAVKATLAAERAAKKN